MVVASRSRMAATSSTCRRLAGFLRVEWPRSVRAYQRMIHRNHAGYVSRVPVVYTSSAISTQLGRYRSTKVESNLDDLEGEEEEEEIQQPPGFFTRLWRWLHTNEDDLNVRVMTYEEKQERDQMLAKLQDLYFADPPQEPDLDFCKDTMRMLIKYNDKLGVDCIWTIIQEMNVEPDEELTYMVVTFLEECRKRELAE